MNAGRSLILCYHRVAEGVVDPYFLCVRPDNFSAHLDELQQRWQPSTLSELSEPSRLPRVAVTFDDGYRDNLLNALPIAQSKGVPIAIFATSGMVGRDTGFWWDRLAVLLRSRPRHVDNIEIRTGERASRIELGQARSDQELNAVRSAFLPLSVSEIEQNLQQVSEEWSVSSASPSDARAVDQTELRQLADSELVTIGAHTVDHVRLRGQAGHYQRDTIVNSKAELERTLGRTVSHFAYPFGQAGDFDDVSVDAVRSAGFETACTTLPGWVSPSTDRHLLPRHVIPNWGRLRFRAELQRLRLTMGRRQRSSPRPY
jgi:peptidoglycan/xylan/chitin deacetylase (PgdA/CDA1 family)